MNTFIQHMNQLPLYHEGHSPFINKKVLANLYTLFHKTYHSIDMAKVEYHIDRTPSTTIARARKDLRESIKIKHIETYVLDNAQGDLRVYYRNGGVELTILFSLFSDSDSEIELYKRYVVWIVHWIEIAHQFSEKKCVHPVNLHLYLTPFKKELSNIKEVLGEPHVNTAYTWHCSPNNRIVLYRLEEWFKVLIHESFHFFGFENFKKKDEARLKDCFPLPVDLHVGEAYGEFWARVINCFYCAYFINKDSSRQSSVLTHFYRMIYIERIYSCYQAMKILRYMGITYTDLYSSSHLATQIQESYQEKSNVFCYYILVSILMNQYQDTMEWCHKHNTKLFNINLKDSHLFVDYIKEICKSESYLYNMEHLGRIHVDTDRSLRMTLLDFL